MLSGHGTLAQKQSRADSRRSGPAAPCLSNLNRAQLLEAKENLDRYFDLAVRIFPAAGKRESSRGF